MAIVKIVFRDIGGKGDKYEIKAESFPEITEEQANDPSKLSIAQFVALKVLEFINNGLEDEEEKKAQEKLLEKAHKSNKGLH